MSSPKSSSRRNRCRRANQSRLLHLSSDGTIDHRRFDALPELLGPGDLLVMNDTKVFSARLLGHRPTGGAVELLLLDNVGDDTWRVLGKPAKKLRVGTRLSFGDGALEGEVIDQESLTVRFDYDGDWDALVDALGRTPLPPYIRPSGDERATRERYQTVYAKARGSVAAPTAGLHFTDAIFEALKRRGIDTATITLHVGYATFEPVRTDDVSEHRMGVEHFEVPRETAERIRARASASSPWARRRCAHSNRRRSWTSRPAGMRASCSSSPVSIFVSSALW